jgi:hypothetical protein
MRALRQETATSAVLSTMGAFTRSVNTKDVGFDEDAEAANQRTISEISQIHPSYRS